MKKITFIVFLIFCFSLILGFNATAKTQLTYSNFFPPTHFNSQLAESWCREVEKRTNGDVIIKYFPAGTLTKAPQTYDSVVQGIADIGMTVLAYSRGRFTVASAIDLPMGYKSGVQATRVANAVLNKFQPEEFDDSKMMFLHAHGPGLIHTRDKAVSTMEDLKGLKLRGTGTSGLVQAALGASPVGKSMRECYQMLQKGVVDGSSHPIEANKGWKLGEVVHYMTQNFSTAYTTTMAVFMNKNKWNKLGPANQKIIEEINAEWLVKHGEAWDEADKLGLEFFLSKGGKVISLSDDESKKWETAAFPVIEDYIRKAEEKGVDGKAVVDFIKTNM
ncbi:MULTISPECIES: TRAP transporter substrate-binding protein [Desulfobacula]|uniref:DctP3: TRAP dicarboxylate transporter periplasmic binding protein n=2 Tax=Desulfobacula TaxID=28222 RepID=K0NCX9_DESTT|nr:MULTISPECIES: TRAP transporter substrate-binding protein [Desulfobacula]CCK78555.1 DctP3: TRAP dicarboxylate transporter periplasmic binding protein [Desulfobacula toluolica Tol2]SDT89994.1 TRAP-type C4-dicarboxylate transport system, substrate-binding protein [Desulfobacula phenolica]